MNLPHLTSLGEAKARANILLDAADASDHEGAARAIISGLVSGHTAEKPGYLLHTGGTGILTYFDSKDNFTGLGKWSDKEFNDWDGVSELTSLPDEAFHRNVDKIVLEAGSKHGDILKTVIVCPPTIYGKGRGPGSTRGRQVYGLASLVLRKGDTPIVGEGKARWNNVHIEDLSNVFALLVEKAVAGDKSDELWGAKGYILTENGEHVWGDLSRLVAKEAEKLGYISNPKEQSLSVDAAMDDGGFESVSWGLNSRAKAIRARKLLGWKPVKPSIEAEVPAILKDEKERLG